MMLVVYVSVLLMLSASIVSTESGQAPYEMDVWNEEDQSLWEQLSTLQKEMESLSREQVIINQRQKAIDRMLIIENVTSLTESGRHQLFSPPHLWPNGEDEDDEFDNLPNYDPCHDYRILDQAWRATNYITKRNNVSCDRLKWQGWYRLKYRGKNIQMPERCIQENRCGTHAPLWLTEPHPNRRDGIVSRRLCGTWKKRCCAFKSNPIKVKACRGNYYVYRLVPPTACHLGYCADVNTLVCGRCGRGQYCTSRDRITYRCADRKKKKKKIKEQVIHFFASYPGNLTGKVKPIPFRKVLVNEGAGFNSQTGVFKAPVSGVYQFYFSSQSGGSGRNATDLQLVIKNTTVAVSRADVKTPASIGTLGTYMTPLDKGAEIYVTQVTGQSWANSASNTITFGGSLLMQRGLK